MSYTGVVAQFGVRKGYGFINCDKVEGDVFFGRKALPEECRFEIPGFSLRGRTVGFELGAPNEQGKPTASQVWLTVEEGSQCAGTIKSYNPQKGYGFLATTSLEEQDFFFAKRDLPLSHQHLELKGQTAAFTVASQDGKLQAKNLLFKEVAMPMAPMGVPGMMPMSLQMMPVQMQVAQLLGGGKHKGPVDGQSRQGTVARYNAEKGFGFVKTGDMPDMYFKDSSGTLDVGSTVAFRLKIMPDGKLQAREITVGLVAGETYQGTIDTYNPIKGWGFIAVEGFAAQVYFKKDTLSHGGDQELAGSPCRVTVNLTPDGKPQAQAVAITGPVVAGAGGMGGVKRQINGAVGPAAAMTQVQKRMRPSVGGNRGGASKSSGVVTSYNPAKGFGFIKCPTAAGDVFLSKSQLQLAGFTGLEEWKNKQLTFNITTSPQGKPQAVSIAML